MKRCKETDDYFAGLIKEIPKKSKDPTSKVGCLAVNQDYEVITTGYNGFPRRVKDDPNEVPERYERKLKLLYTGHAEENLVAISAKNGKSLNNSIVYINRHPCAKCMGLLINSGVIEVVICEDDDEFNERWREDIEVAKIKAEEAEITIRIIGKRIYNV